MSEILTPEQVAEIRQRAYWANISAEATPQVHAALRLCATVKAQTEVIQRYKDGWRPTGGKQWRGWWTDEYLFGNRDREPMSEVEQLVIYGEVVAPRSA